MVVGFTSFCSGADGVRHQKKEIHGVGLAVRESFVTGVDKVGLVAECISATRSMELFVHLQGMPSSVSFVAGYACPRKISRQTRSITRGKRVGSVIVRIPSEDHLLVLTYANDRIGEKKDGGVLTARCWERAGVTNRTETERD